MKKKDTPKRPKDVNQLAHFLVEESTRESNIISFPKKKNPAAVALGRLGGKKGGKIRAANLPPEKRSQIASLAARARWAKKED
jgi:hypothetical protein